MKIRRLAAVRYQWTKVDRLRRTSTDNSFDGVGEERQISDSVDGKHVLGVGIAGNC